ncbi:rhodanese-like domain-containing protein [Psychrosphaera sp. B3R10]|uniref:rhodanese-like domain-containing protein n=1 Tax=unclassified Psychrosphaera TaxID=2641570 RepID=UPI001C07F359|nr:MULTISPECIES: rhodanese-like domain-containing protein [unclassified Psychrosphaera]MBU2882597.1 rhodanese-like domain-containing protein [Psychrosphaera sp. I2R16]MBU2989384.1 rhodanese-like domain-containing protein [Psychrosphaera sp. B3R10]MDO6718218.1 rhodanese-like domain-containing protein [Psychrosphaera sp. 1_MG-2023]
MTQFIEFLGNHYMMTMAWAILFVMLVSSFVSGAMSPIKVIGTQDLTMMVNRSNGVVVDVRPQADFAKGHITDALNLTLDKITSEQFGSLEKRKSDPIVVVCNAGVSAKSAARLLSKAGFEQVTVLQGGMQTWTGANLPVVKKK